MGHRGDEFEISGKEVGNGFCFAPVAFGEDDGRIVASILAYLDGAGLQEADSRLLISNAQSSVSIDHRAISQKIHRLCLIGMDIDQIVGAFYFLDKEVRLSQHLPIMVETID